MADVDERQDRGHASRGLSGVAEVLRGWEGTNAIVLGSGLTHRHMRIELWQEGRPTQLIVLCSGPDYYCGPMIWQNSHVKVGRVPDNERVEYRAEFELRDEGARVRMVGGDVHLIEEPAHHWRQARSTDSNAG